MPIQLKFFEGSQEIIISIHQLAMRNPSKRPYFLISGNFWRENGRGHHARPNGLGSPNRTKRLAHWVDLLNQLLSLNHTLKVFRHELPPPPLK